MSGTRKPTRQEVKARAITVANSMREYLTDRREKAIARRALDKKAALLVGKEGGGSGITVTMRRISGEASSREPEFVARHAGPNRATRRATARREQKRMLPGPNKPWYAPTGLDRGDRE